MGERGAVLKGCSAEIGCTMTPLRQENLLRLLQELFLIVSLRRTIVQPAAVFVATLSKKKKKKERLHLCIAL